MRFALWLEAYNCEAIAQNVALNPKLYKKLWFYADCLEEYIDPEKAGDLRIFMDKVDKAAQGYLAAINPIGETAIRPRQKLYMTMFLIKKDYVKAAYLKGVMMDVTQEMINKNKDNRVLELLRECYELMATGGRIPDWYASTAQNLINGMYGQNPDRFSPPNKDLTYESLVYIQDLAEMSRYIG